MNIWKTAFATAAGLVILLFAVLAAVPAARANHDCIPVDAAVARIEAVNGVFFGLVDVPNGDGFDQIMIASLTDNLFAVGFKDGCYLPPAIPIGKLRDLRGV